MERTSGSHYHGTYKSYSGPYLTLKDMADLKRLEAIHNSKVKRGERKRKANEHDTLSKDLFKLRCEIIA